MASDDDFFVIRKFGRASARATLFMQDQITQLEEELEYEDHLCRQAPKEDADCGTFRLDHWPRRKQILADLASSLERYRTDPDRVDSYLENIANGVVESFILNHSALKARPKASDFQIRNVKQWLQNANDPIRSEEVSFIDRHEDLIPMVSKEGTPLRRFLLDKLDRLNLTSCIRERKASCNFSTLAKSTS